MGNCNLLYWRDWRRLAKQVAESITWIYETNGRTKEQTANAGINDLGTPRRLQAVPSKSVQPPALVTQANLRAEQRMGIDPLGSSDHLRH